MKRKIEFVVFNVLLALLVAACASTSPDKNTSLWPQKQPFISLYNYPQKMNSVEEAIGTIKNLQRDFVEWGAGIHFSYIDVDAYGLRARWEWTETTQSTEYVPSYSGMFIGWNYVPIYGGSYHTQTLTEQKNDLLTIPFDEVARINLFHMPDIPRENKWGIEVWLQDNRRIAFRASSEHNLMKLNRSIATLALERGAPYRPASLGFDAAPLTMGQSRDLDLSPGTGLLVFSVAKGGPAERAGIQFMDVILALDGTVVNGAEDLMGILKNAYASGKKEVSARILTRGQSTQAAAGPSPPAEKSVRLTLPY